MDKLDIQAILVKIAIVIGVMMVVNRVDFLKKLILGEK